MGRKGNWFSSVKKALSPESKKREDERSNKSKKKWFGKQKLQTSDSYLETDKALSLSPPEEVKLTNIENENNHAPDADVEVEVTNAVDTEEPVPAVQTAPVPVQASIIPLPSRKLSAEVAAMKIQTAFRGYMARRALRALRGLVRLKSLMEGPAVKRQATSTLRSMQTLARLQAQIRTRRIRMLEENQALQRQFLQKHAKELSLQMGDEWDDSLQSKEQIEAKLLSKYEATVRRERALAYAFSHQQNGKNSTRSINPVFMDPTNPAWGWSWLERWMAARPWESKDVNDQSSVKSSTRSITGGEISKSYARYQLNSEKHSPTASQNLGSPSFHSHSTPSKALVSSASVIKKLKKVSPKVTSVIDDDTKSMVSVQSGFRRHSIAGSSVGDDESLASFQAVPSYMVPTQSAKAKSKPLSPLTVENDTVEKGSSGTVKKRLSFPPSPARPRRHSGPPKVESSFNAEVTVGNSVAD
ncbi:protein IQ-DOMAIN 2-like [Prosopis cineraria]|uniref:protein IQ-DOMAIN 2-like n=1 Tax=Prosopis cineraria TaxID=364024 RepID=UPI00240FF6ED|nr:protein IQ-DOMAIN 2-like [Prosopis cineraria]XP_054801767.1 protein IQ-DOMAIN 2-like [Prosopis cineraria]XP_054801768.1 protein IQ-DOMAIN 2-like [Prosopis cineraria]